MARTVVAVADLADMGILDEDEEDTSRCGITEMGASARQKPTSLHAGSTLRLLYGA